MLDSGKEELQSIEYESAKEGSIYTLKDSEWQWLTPAVSASSSSSPVIDAPQQAKDKTSAKAPLGSVTGTIIVLPNVFGARIAYINGEQLYLHSADWPDMKIGDNIRAYGETGAYYGEPRFKIKSKKDISIISRNNSANPVSVSGDEIDDSYIGRLIAVEGEIIELSAQKIFMDSAGVEILIYKKSSALSFLGFKKGDALKATGILSKYNDDYRLLPRNDNDLAILASIKNKSTVDRTIPYWQYVVSTSVIGILGGGACYLRRKKCQLTRQ